MKNIPRQGYSSLYPLSVEDQEALLNLVDEGDSNHGLHPPYQVIDPTLLAPESSSATINRDPNGNAATDRDERVKSTNGFFLSHFSITRTIKHDNIKHPPAAEPGPVDSTTTTTASSPPDSTSESAPTKSAYYGPTPVPGPFLCQVKGCGKNYSSMTRLKSHQVRYHRSSLFCTQPKCNDRTDYDSVIDLYEHARKDHLNADTFWCHLCHRVNGMIPGAIQLHVAAMHLLEDPGPDILLIQTELDSRLEEYVQMSMVNAGVSL